MAKTKEQIKADFESVDFGGLEQALNGFLTGAGSITFQSEAGTMYDGDPCLDCFSSPVYIGGIQKLFKNNRIELRLVYCSGEKLLAGHVDWYYETYHGSNGVEVAHVWYDLSAKTWKCCFCDGTSNID
jgi:hypothetical protein